MKDRSARQQSPQRVTKEREEEAAKMRLSGMTWAEIGRHIGYSAKMADQLGSAALFRMGENNAAVGRLKK